MEDINKEKEALDAEHWETQTGVVVLSYPRYCRYRGLLKRLEGVADEWMRSTMILALGGFTCPWKNTRILFCKETFDYPELEGHELLCNHLAPKLKGRPRKRKRTNQSPTESETESESSQSTSSSSASKPKNPLKAASTATTPVKPRLRCTLEVSKRPSRGPASEERNFISALHIFMNGRKTPIGKIPIVGFKEVNLFKLYKKVSELGGYDMVTAGKLWKYVYEVMGGDMTSTSAATLSRRHYEKLLLPYERHLNGNRTSPQKPKAPLALPQISHQVSLTPLLKKQKLEILKEGGLEVTPVGGGGSGGRTTGGGPPPPPAQQAAPSPSAQARLSIPSFRDSKVSITVTPDMSHLLTPGPSSSSSKRPVYGNPKLFTQAPPAQAGEILDLRTKPRINIGSNLEITLVPQATSGGKGGNTGRSAAGGQVRQAHHQSQRQSQSRQHGSHHTQQHQHRQVSTPSAQQGQGSQPNQPLPYPPSLYKPPHLSYLPMLDQRSVYLSALYNNMYRPYGPQALPQVANVYKELLRRQGIFPSLDGTTSITLVGQTPTSK